VSAIDAQAISLREMIAGGQRKLWFGGDLGHTESDTLAAR